VVGGGVVLFSLMVAVLAPIIAPYELKQEFYGEQMLPPSTKFWFGTDSGGKDVFSWVVWGARTSLYVGFASVLIEILIGCSIGMIAGYFGGIIDEILMRITDVVLTLPTLMLLILAVSMFQVRSINIIIMVMGGLGWPFMARVVRSEFLSLRESTFVEAARSMGASSWRIILRHILPNTLPTLIILVTIDIPGYIFWESALTFLGFGDPLSASWGVLIDKGTDLLLPAPWITAFPGLALFFTSLGFNLFGDGLRDALDVKTRA
ncbi:MAG: ABC transporter permease, partial [Candidatus Bathyarchaeota archaeon]|nr:ABC transporter permease [Candidatus Bathyarchaeota archaeon]